MSADGSRIAFVSKGRAHSHQEIYVADIDGSNRRRLTEAASNSWQPTWSADGEKIAFVANWSGNLEIHMMNRDGTEPEQLTDHPREDQFPAFSPDGSMLAFASTREGDFDIYLLDLADRSLRRLTERNGSEHSPCWSPDGERLGYIARNGRSTELHIMNADGSDDSVIGTSAIGPAKTLAWSPDGSQLAFLELAGRGGTGRLQIVSAGGGEIKTVQESVRLDGGLSWFRDDRLVFTKATGNKASPRRPPTRLWSIGIDGSDPRPLPRR